MKAQRITFFISFLFIFAGINSFSQINIESGPAITPEDMVEYLVGPGISYDNVTYQGVDPARGIFTNGNTTNIGIDEGIFLTSGAGYMIPGPNNSTSSSVNNGSGGHPWLTAICGVNTYDAAVLSFSFVPMNDTVRCWYVFGSEEYNEWVNATFNDVFGFFVYGPDPMGGVYDGKNIAIVPGTTNTSVAINNVNNGNSPGGVVPTGPCENCEFFLDNTNGQTIQYDGFTVALPAYVLVIPGEEYTFTMGVADAGDGIYDSGVLLEGTSFKSPGPADFFQFNFLKENNPDLTFDVIGQLDENNVYLEIPDGVDPSSLVASFEEHGADVFIDGIRQESGITPNDFTETLTYVLEGYEVANWNVYVDIVTDIPHFVFGEVKIGPNPAIGGFYIENASNISISIYNTLGNIVYEKVGDENHMLLNDLEPGLYFVKLENQGSFEVRKVVVQ